MTAKPKPAKALTDPVKEKDEAKNRARLAFSPSVNASVLAQDFSFHPDLDLADLLEVMTRECTDVHGGDLRRVESMLISQAHSLDVIFASMARRAALNAGEYMGAAETYLKLALKAQSQCRATLETLATIKNPPVVFAKQANIANGPQQVNNNAAPSLAHAEQFQKPQTELLEHAHGQWLDTGTAAAASGSNQTVETVAAIHRTTHNGRQGHGEP